MDHVRRVPACPLESQVRLLVIALMAACSTTGPMEPSVDAGVNPDVVQVDSSSDGSNADGIVDSTPDMPSADLCNMTGDGTFASQCCPFEDSCGAGLFCYYDWSNENQPTQEHSQCLPSPSSAPTLGQECPANGDCADGLFCDRVMSGETGRCRELCDATHTCSSGLTCRGIPVCAQGMCIEAQGELGYCAP